MTTNIIQKAIDKKWTSAAFAVSLLSLPLFFASAQGPFEERDPEEVVVDSEGIFELLEDLFTIAYSLFFALTAFFILYAGFLYLTAGGDEEKMGKAKNVLVYALIAVVIAVLSYGLANVVADLLIG